jgi:hypothetical protein
MKKYKSLVLLVVVLICSFAPAHKFYFSLTAIKVNSDNKNAAISCKLFTEDLEEILYLKTKLKFDLSKSLESKTANDAIFNYVNENLLISQQNKKMPLKFIGFELEGDVTWVFIEAPMNSSKIKTLTITNTLLCDLTQEQTNLMQINWNGKDFSEKLTCSNYRFELKAIKQ